MPLPPEVAILTRCRFGSQRLLFLLLAWLTLLPVVGPFPQIAHFFDMKNSFNKPRQRYLEITYRISLILSAWSLFKEENLYTFFLRLTSILLSFFAHPGKNLA
jgi:hypothetical protein